MKKMLYLKYMLDTHIVIYVIKGKPMEILDVFNLHARRMAISSITLAELFHGNIREFERGTPCGL